MCICQKCKKRRRHHQEPVIRQTFEPVTAEDCGQVIEKEYDCGKDQEIIKHKHIVKHQHDIINEYEVVHEHDYNYYDVVTEREVVRNNDYTNHNPNYCEKPHGCTCPCRCR